MSQFAALISALVPLLSLAGAAVAWFLRRMDKRIAAAEKKVGECEGHRAGDKETIERLMFEVRRDGLAIRMLCSELHTVSPGNATLNNVAAVLRQQYDPALAIPNDFTDLLATIERGDRQ